MDICICSTEKKKWLKPVQTGWLVLAGQQAGFRGVLATFLACQAGLSWSGVCFPKATMVASYVVQ